MVLGTVVRILALAYGADHKAPIGGPLYMASDADDPWGQSILTLFRISLARSE